MIPNPIRMYAAVADLDFITTFLMTYHGNALSSNLPLLY